MLRESVDGYGHWRGIFSPSEARLIADEPPELQPWEAEPSRLWSLWDMLTRHYAGNWMAVVGSLERLKWMTIACQCGDVPPDDMKHEIERVLDWLPEEFGHMPFSESLKNQMSRLERRLRAVVAEPESVRQSGHALTTMLDELKDNTQAELKVPLFLIVPPSRKGWYHRSDVAVFGDDVATAFPDSTRELAEAGRCFALARWTACVFHLMRALEIALHRWAEQIGVNQFSAIELENWKNIIDAADRKVRELEKMPKSAAKDSEVRYFGETSAHYRSVKDAWRNHVAHARTSYDEQQAAAILSHVREFMCLLAAKP
jgi:hypothetical protein